MKRIVMALFIFLVPYSTLIAQSEAGAIFADSTRARAGGMGEAQVAVANDAYASYWNPAGLGFLEGQELAMMHVNWLPGSDDLFFSWKISYTWHLGGHLIFLNLGEQIVQVKPVMS